MSLKKQSEFVATDHILSLAWAGETLVVTPTTGPILRVNVGGDVLNEWPDHGLGNGASGVKETTVATCGFDGRVRLHSLVQEGEPIEVKLGRGWIERCKWSPDGKHLGAPLGKTLFILDETGATVESFPDHQTSVSDLAWNPTKANEVATVCGGGARMWRLGEKEPFAKFDWGGASLLVSWGPDGRWIVTGDQTPSVHLYDFTRDYPLHIQGYEVKVKGFDFSPNGRKLATGGSPQVTVWTCTGKTGPEGTMPAQLQFHKGDVEAIAWSPKGDLLATGDVVGRVVFSNKEGKPVSAFESKEGISALAWSKDGSCLASGDAAGNVSIFALAS